MSTRKVKIIESVTEVWWERTHEVTVNIDGREISIRYNESPKWGETYILYNDNWITSYDCDDKELVAIVDEILIDGILEFTNDDQEFDIEIDTEE